MIIFNGPFQCFALQYSGSAACQSHFITNLLYFSYAEALYCHMMILCFVMGVINVKILVCYTGQPKTLGI